MPTDDDGSPLGAGQPSNVGSQPGSTDADVQEQEPRAPLVTREIQHQDVRQRSGAGVDVSADGQDGGHAGQRIEHLEVADVARVEDGVGPPGGQMPDGLGMG